MINTSNEYKQAICGSRVFYAGAKVTPVIGTIPDLTNADIISLKIDDATSKSGTFQIGSAIINKLTLVTNNDKGQLDSYDFTDAIIRPTQGLQLSETIETLKKGGFTVDDSKAVGSTIIITALDNMNKFDTPFSNVTQIFPCTALQLLQSTCLHCGVYLATVSFLNSDFIIERRPSDEATTCREIVAWIAQMSGNFARCNVDGALELKWYDIGAFESSDSLDGGRFDNTEETSYQSGDNADGGNFTDYSSGDNIDGGTFLDMDRYHHIYSLGSATIGTDDVIITGIRVKAMGVESDYDETVLFGSNGYVIEISGNPLIQEGMASTIANSVGAKIVGMRFRPCSISAISDPSREAGDVAYLSHKGNTYQILLTSVSSQAGSNDNISCDAETPSKKQSVRFDAQTKAIVEARKIAKQEISAYDQVVQQFTNLMTYGFGLHKSEEKLDDGSTIYYMHDKPARAESSAIWKFGSNGLVLSTDQGITWGVDTNGNMLVKVLTAIGVDAEWIEVLTSFTVGDYFSVDKYGKLIAKLVDISGKITADSGKIGPYLIDEFGIESDVVRLSEHPLFPGMRLRKRGDSGKYVKDEDDNSREMNLQAGYILFETIDSGVKTEVRLIGKSDSFTSIPGSIRISKVDVSGEFEKNISSAEMAIDDTAFIKIMNYTSGVFDSRMELTGQSLTMESYTGSKAIYEFSDSILNISASVVNITGGTVNINGQEF